MSSKDDKLNWPAAFFMSVVIIVAATFVAGPEFWLKVLG